MVPVNLIAPKVMLLTMEQFTKKGAVSRFTGFERIGLTHTYLLLESPGNRRTGLIGGYMCDT